MLRFKGVESHVLGTMAARTRAVVLAFVAVALLAATLANASTSLVGLYFDESGSTHCDSLAVGFPRTVYLILKGINDPVGTVGWQCRLERSSGVLLTGTTIYGQGINVGSGSEYIVGLSSPLASGETVVLAEFEIFAIRAGGIAITSLSSGAMVLPAYLPASNLGTLMPMRLEFGGNGEWSIVFGAMPCPTSNSYTMPVADDETSWGSIKTMFR